MSLDQARDGGTRGRRRRKKAKEEKFKSSLIKGSDILHDKMKIIGDFEPWLRPTSVQGINTRCAEKCMCEVGTLGEQSARCLCLSPLLVGH